MTADLQERVAAAQRQVTGELLAQLGSGGHWAGELSSSALSTATAITALGAVDRNAHATYVEGGLGWLAAHANPDGGWGDTTKSKSNLSTTALVWAAFGHAQGDGRFALVMERAVGYLTRLAGSLENLVPAIESRYGRDRTFSVPITMTLALSGRLGPRGWQRVRPLPFELAALPRGFFGALRLPVVSYALPALIAIGQAIHHHAPRFNPLRSWSRRRTLQVLTGLQPVNGGFLEATPLTSFVTMSLASMGEHEHPVARRGADFLRKSVRRDGSWPIDTNLATWTTTLAVKALRHQPNALSPEQRRTLRDWLLGQQYRAVHAYTGAAPGGWAWTDLPGGVPDADDTAGTLLALHLLSEPEPAPDPVLLESVQAGVTWLLDIQNGDGGIPTFCRGWGTLPFDRSTPELTAHVLRAWLAWRSHMPPPIAARIAKSIKRAVRFLAASQTAEGAWIPLWFGNEHVSADANPVYGTAQVLPALRLLMSDRETATLYERGRQFLTKQQNRDGGWGGGAGVPSTVEETALALEALAEPSESSPVIANGLNWLVQAIEAGLHREATPIGLYFARLWYFERLYPLIFSVGALGANPKGIVSFSPGLARF